MNTETRLEQLERDVDRTRSDYQAAAPGEERDRLWNAHQRALTNWNTAVAQANQQAEKEGLMNLRFPKTGPAA